MAQEKVLDIVKSTKSILTPYNVVADGKITSNKNAGLENMDDVYAQRMVLSGSQGYFQAGKKDRDINDQKMMFSGWFGTPLSQFRISMASGIQPQVYQGGVNYDILHRGNMPNAADVGTLTTAQINAELAKQVSKTGDTMTGNLTAPAVLVSSAQNTSVNALTRKDYVDSAIDTKASNRVNFATGLGISRVITGATVPTHAGVWAVNNSTWTPVDYGSLYVTTNRADELTTAGSGSFIHYLFISHNNARIYSATNVNGSFSGWRLTDADSVNKSGDTMTGSLTLPTAKPLYFGAGNTTYLTRSGDDLFVAAIAGTTGKVIIEGKVNPQVRIGTSNYNIYHAGNKPTSTELGVVNIAGDVMTGNLVVDAGTAAEPQVGVRRSGRRLYMADNGVTVGLYNIIGGSFINTFMISRNINDGNIIVGSDSNNTIIRGAGNLKHGTADIYTTDNRPSPADIGAVAKSGDSMIGQLILTPSFVDTSNNAQLAHIGKDATKPLYIRNMREHNSSAWLWEKVYNGSLYYSSGTNGSGTSKIRLQVSGSGEIYLGVNADKRVYHEGFKPTATDVGAVARNNIAGPLKASLLDTSSEVYAYNAGLGEAGWPWTNSSGTILSMGWARGADKGGAELALNIAGRGLAYRAHSADIGLSEWKQIYHTGFKPTAADVGAVNKTGDTMTGNLTAPKVLLSAAQGTEVNSAARRDFVISECAKQVTKTGDTMTGNLTAPKVLLSSAQGTEANSSTRKDYVDGLISKLRDDINKGMEQLTTVGSWPGV